ncbi:DUF1998 domain-containing protein [Nitrospirillum bahiense]|uniref:Uncharacterized protein DUF1998 n=1 Tax=Nitrospirillum amazonense TaxID=28077 RepID=A0A560FVQ5_9PROT|nr:DUF1998 domain-containing protein [Nitrospirillum amazonense]TWB25631.1 uncharacterized protein DUF1998 [Nitrospirillum amazonense]
MGNTTIRMSQVVGVYGPGAMIDLPERSVIVGSLDRWNMAGVDAFRPIDEPRLARLLQQRLAGDPRLAGDAPPTFRTPPIDPNDIRASRPPSIDAPLFPEWFVCETIDGDKPGRRRLVRFSDLEPQKRKEYIGEDRKKRKVSPVRFVAGCTKGHLQDIDWRWILHRGEPCREAMWLVDSSASADPRDTQIVCDCEKSLTLAELFQPHRLGNCTGERPWIGDRDPVTCDAPKGLRLLTRSATNTYFPQVATVISLPQAVDELTRRIEQHLSSLRTAQNAAWISIARVANPAIGAALEGYDDEDVFARLQTILASSANGDDAKDPRLAEFELFSCGRALIGENAPTALLHAETLDRAIWDPADALELESIGSLVAVHRLREVSCLYGFTRLEPAAMANDELEDVGLAVEGAPLAARPTWLPAIEQFGEGFFLTFKPEALRDWLLGDGLLSRAYELEAGIATWERIRRDGGLSLDRRSLGERVRPEYVMAHSLAHALMTQVALDCGYPASSLKERIYVPPVPASGERQAGILIYTASAGMQGTLGGLVEVTRRFHHILANALERLRLCSGDPVCADHEPGKADEDRALHGAACHGCLLIAETSCEARNLHLDRALLVDTVRTDGAGIFEAPF